MTINEIFSEKSAKIKFWIFSIFQKSGDFAGFLMKNWLYLGMKLTYLDPKSRFGKGIKFSSKLRTRKYDLKTF